jgi:predicted dinucleotide-binding enzyme
MKKIGVLGSGDVGKVLAGGFIKLGYEVLLGSRDLNKIKEWREQNPKNAEIGSFKDSAAFGDTIVLAVKGSAAENALHLAGLENFKGKTIIDTTNPIDDLQAPVNGVIKFFTNQNESMMERLQKLVPGANFVKAFNSVGNAFMVNPDFGGIKPTMFICGNNTQAKKEVTEILEKFGWESEDMGTANAAGTIENLCILWCIPGIIKNQWSHAFKLLKK